MGLPADISTALDRPLGRFRALDPMTQITTANELTDTLKHGISEIGDIRRMAVRRLRAEGWTLKEIGQATGMTVQRVHQIETGYDRSEKTRRQTAD